jgi:hypothetical protein
MNSGTFDWVDALVKIEEKRQAAQPKPTKKARKVKGANS